METIFKRRSIRRYLNKPIKNDQLLSCIKAGMNAPSAGNEQPWQFVIINDREILDQIPGFHPHAKMLMEAPAAILVCADLRLLKFEEYWIQDCAAATQNILLAITDLHLGGVWIGVYPRENRVNELKKLLKLPEQIIPFSLIAVGYPAEKKPSNNRYEAERVHINSWENKEG